MGSYNLPLFQKSAHVSKFCEHTGLRIRLNYMELNNHHTLVFVAKGAKHIFEKFKHIFNVALISKCLNTFRT